MASGSPSPAAATLTCRLGPDRVTKPIRTCGTQVQIRAFCAPASRAGGDRWVTSWGWRPPVRSVEVVPEDVGPGRVAQLGHGLGLDLADALPGHAVDLADLLQGLGLAVGQPEPHGDHAGLAFGQRVEHRVQLLLQQGEAGRLAGLDRLGVLDQVAELAVAVLT